MRRTCRELNSPNHLRIRVPNYLAGQEAEQFLDPQFDGGPASCGAALAASESSKYLLC
jgi:hypothetical protein